MMNVCPVCDAELELIEVESFQDLPDSNTLTEFNSYACPCCGRKYRNEVVYSFKEETPLQEGWD